jgi:hypothetical protein
MIEKDGTGIEKSGTGIEKSGTGIEKSGTGIEKSGTGIEKSGTGIRKGLLALSMASIAFASQINASQLQPEGTLSLVVQNDTLLVSWIIDGSIFSGVSALSGTTANLSLTEITLASPDQLLEVTGGGTGKEVTGGGTGKEVTGGGTGKEVTGGGTGAEVTGGGTGAEVTGGGTGAEVTGGGTGAEVTGGGTGAEVTGGGTGAEVTGGGTGAEVTGGGTGAEVTGGGTGAESSDTFILVTGGGTGQENIAITLPDGTGLEMEITLGCKTASVSVLDANYTEVVSFNNIKVMGETGLCQSSSYQVGSWFNEDSLGQAPSNWILQEEK